MQLHLSATDGVPIYLQIVNQVKYLVASGRLTPGEELPPIRVLAEQLLGKHANRRHFRARREPARRHQVFHLVDDLQVDGHAIVCRDAQIHRRVPGAFSPANRTYALLLY